MSNEPDLLDAQEIRPAAAPRARWGVMLAALALAFGGWWVAPAPWPEGPGGLEVASDGAVVLREEVRFGSTEAVEARGTLGDLEVEVSIPGGLPRGGVVRAHVRVWRGGEARLPSPGSLRTSLRLPDGREELVPVLRSDPARGTLEAERRPPVGGAIVLALLGLVVVLWVTEAIPLFVTSLLVPVVLVVAGVGTAGEALAPFFHPIIALFFGGFLMAEAMRRVGLDRWIAVHLVAKAGRSPMTLFVALMAVSAFLSMWMSNTASTAVLIPIALAVTAPIGNLGYRKAVVLAIAYAATLGGVGSAIGTPANPLAIAFLREFAGKDISFAGWFAYGLPVVVCFLPVLAAWLWWRSGARVEREGFDRVRAAAAAEVRSAGRLGGPAKLTLVVFAATIAVWLTQTWHGLDTGIVALGAAVLMAVLGLVRPEDLGRISWASLLTFGGGLTLGGFLVRTGTSDWLAARAEALAALPTAIGVAAVAAFTLALTAVASNTATAAMLVPLAIPLAGVLGVEPTLLVAVVAIASSIDFALVIGTPPTLIAYSTGLYDAREIFRKGIVLDLFGLLVLLAVAFGVWRLLGIA